MNRKVNGKKRTRFFTLNKFGYMLRKYLQTFKETFIDKKKKTFIDEKEKTFIDEKEKTVIVEKKNIYRKTGKTFIDKKKKQEEKSKNPTEQVLLTTMSSMGTGMNIFGLSLGFWLMNRDTLYNMTIHMIEISIVIQLVDAMFEKKSLYV